MSVGTQVVGQAIGISRIGLRPGGTPAGAGGGKCIRVDRVDWVTGGQQAFDQEPVGSLDGHRDLLWGRQSSQSAKHTEKALLRVRKAEPHQQPAVVVYHREFVPSCGPIDTSVEHQLSSFLTKMDLTPGIEGRAGFLLIGPFKGLCLMPVFGPRPGGVAETHPGLQRGNKTWPSPTGHRGNT